MKIYQKFHHFLHLWQFEPEYSDNKGSHKERAPTRDIVSVVDGRKRACKPPSVQFNRGKKAKGAVAGKRGSIRKMGEPSQSAVSKWCTGQGWRQMLYAFLPL